METQVFFYLAYVPVVSDVITCNNNYEMVDNWCRPSSGSEVNNIAPNFACETDKVETTDPASTVNSHIGNKVKDPIKSKVKYQVITNGILKYVNHLNLHGDDGENFQTVQDSSCTDDKNDSISPTN